VALFTGRRYRTRLVLLCTSIKRSARSLSWLFDGVDELLVQQVPLDYVVSRRRLCRAGGLVASSAAR
jgi:hypothetical protein